MNDYIVVTDSGRFNVPAYSHADAVAALNLGNPLDEIHDGAEVLFRWANGEEISVLLVASEEAALRVAA